MVPCGCDLFFAVADLGGSKDTVAILAALNACFSTLELTNTTDYQRDCCAYPSTTVQLIEKALIAIRDGDCAGLAILMRQAQDVFDTLCAPVITIISSFTSLP
jgi:hypothetical protein